MVALKDMIKRNKVVLLVIGGNNYQKSILNFIKAIDDEKIIYISINKGADVVIQDFKEKNISTDNIKIIDCISKTLMRTKSQKNVSFLSSPMALTELSLTLFKNMEENSIILIDSLSSLEVYHGAHKIVRFITSLSNRLTPNSRIILVLTTREKEANSELIRKLEVLIDEKIEFE